MGTIGPSLFDDGDERRLFSFLNRASPEEAASSDPTYSFSGGI